MPVTIKRAPEMETTSIELETGSLMTLQARRAELESILRSFFFKVLLMPDRVTALECVKMTEIMEELEGLV